MAATHGLFRPQRAEQFLLCGKELWAVDREERIALANYLTDVIDKQLVNPTFRLDVDAGHLGFVGLHNP